MHKNELKIGITLSGGGVRAAVFHLGVLARLADEELLEKIEMTSTVSGGTLVTGMIYTANKKRWPTSSEFKEFCIPYIKNQLTGKSLQLDAILRIFLNPWLLYHGRAKVLAKSLQHCWGIKGNLNDIPIKPRWNINSCTIESGKCWRFIPRERMGDYILNYVEKPDILLADAICSSAAVPFLIGSLIIRSQNYKWFEYKPDKSTELKNPKFRKIHIWDGGVYDNLGMEALVKYDKGCVYRKEFDFLIISDASKAIEPGKPFFQSNAFRLLDITTDQVRSLRARTLMDHFEHKKNSGVYLKIGNTVQEILHKSKWEGDIEQASRESLSSDEVDRARHYKTTLRKMSDEDFAMIFKHGWEVADATLSAYCPELFSQIKYNGL